MEDYGRGIMDLRIDLGSLAKRLLYEVSGLKVPEEAMLHHPEDMVRMHAAHYVSGGEFSFLERPVTFHKTFGEQLKRLVWYLDNQNWSSARDLSERLHTYVAKLHNLLHREAMNTRLAS